MKSKKWPFDAVSLGKSGGRCCSARGGTRCAAEKMISTVVVEFRSCPRSTLVKPSPTARTRPRAREKSIWVNRRSRRAVLSRWLHRFQLGRPEWANIIFTAVAVFGGLFCAFYFFNGADVVRSARNWPQEYFYARPVFMSPDAAPSIRDPAGLAKESVMRSAQQGSGNPFSRSTPLIASNPFLPPALPGAFGPLSSTGGMLPSGGNGGGGVPGSALPGPGPISIEPGFFSAD